MTSPLQLLLHRAQIGNHTGLMRNSLLLNEKKDMGTLDKPKTCFEVASVDLGPLACSVDTCPVFEKVAMG